MHRPAPAQPRHARRPEDAPARQRSRHRSRRWWTRPVALLGLVGTVAGGAQLGTGEAAQAATSEVTITGHGFGHGRGLSQWGSFGYATDKGWSSARILDHYYGGTSAGTIGDDEISVRLLALDGQQTITLTSGADFSVESTPVPAGSAARFTRKGSTWQLTTTTGGCKGTDPGTPVDVGSSPAVWLPGDAGDDRSKMLTVCNNGITYRGNFRPVIEGSGATHLVNFVRIEQYLRGVVPAESPASWADSSNGAAALEAQAVAARSYSRSENRYGYAQTCDTTACQVYAGVTREDRRTDAAIRSTAGVVRRDAKGGVVRTEFSASTGGWTAGGAFPAVQDEGDARSPHTNWKVVVDGPTLARAWPQIGAFSSLEVTARNGLGADGGRVTKAVIKGTSGSVTVTGNQVRSALGLKSDWFSVVAPKTREWMLRATPDPGDPSVTTTTFGGPKDANLACDLDGDGRDSAVSYRDGLWTVRDGHPGDTGAPERSVSYGASWMLPVCGDWDGDGKDGVGVYEPKTGLWYLRNSFSGGAPELKFQYGWSAALPVVGDWDGDGRDSTGVYSAGTWMLRDTPTAGRPDRQLQYGWKGALPITGDWAGSGTSGIGVFSGGRWMLRDTVSPGDPHRDFWYGVAGDAPVPGRWSTDRDGVGVSHPTA